MDDEHGQSSATPHRVLSSSLRVLLFPSLHPLYDGPPRSQFKLVNHLLRLYSVSEPKHHASDAAEDNEEGDVLPKGLVALQLFWRTNTGSNSQHHLAHLHTDVVGPIGLLYQVTRTALRGHWQAATARTQALQRTALDSR